MSTLRLGIGELKVVKQKLVKYSRGEIAHIENIMKTEYKERKHRRLDRVEQTFLTEEETTEVSERDLQSTDRFEMQRETQRTVQTDMKLDAGLKVSGSYGTVNFEASTNFAHASSTIDSQKASSTYAKDVVQRSASKITERVKTVQIRKLLSETEETNTHGFDNKRGPGHVSGIYQWVDKVYEAQVMNYGYRLMYEFMVPEPAAFYLHAQSKKKVKGVTLKEPVAPKNLKPSDLDTGTYEYWVSLYNVKDVTPPPPKVRITGTAIEQASSGKAAETTKTSKELKVPTGYKATFAWAITSRSEYRGDDYDAHFAVIVGRYKLVHSSAVPSGWGPIGDWMGYPDGEVPVAVHGNDLGAYALNIEVKCERTPECMDTWRLKTYASIIEAYQKLKSAYDTQVAAAQLEEETSTVKSSTASRNIEKTELKRACITLFAKETYGQFNAMGEPTGQGYPEIDLTEAAVEGPYVQFLEQAFEWDQMTYLFFPYFWARKTKWVDLLQEENTDTVFTEFLRAGSARVVIPVRRGYETAVAYFEQTGKPWLGGTPPLIYDPLYVSVISEIKAKTDPYDTAKPEGASWEVCIPTTLVILPDEKLPDYTS